MAAGGGPAWVVAPERKPQSRAEPCLRCPEGRPFFGTHARALLFICSRAWRAAPSRQVQLLERRVLG